MKYFQLVKKLGLVGVVAVLALSITQTSYISADISPAERAAAEKAAKAYILTLIGRGKPDKLSWKERCDRIIALLKATENPQYNPIIEAVKEIREMCFAPKIVNRLRRKDVLEAIALFPKEPGEQALTLGYADIVKIVAGLI